MSPFLIPDTVIFAVTFFLGEMWAREKHQLTVADTASTVT